MNNVKTNELLNINIGFSFIYVFNHISYTLNEIYIKANDTNIHNKFNKPNDFK